MNPNSHAETHPFHKNPLTLTEQNDYPFTAIVEVALEQDSSYRIHPSTHDQVAKNLAGRGPVVAQGIDVVRVIFGVCGPDMAAAQRDAMGIAEDTLALLGLPGFPLSSVHVRMPRAEVRHEAVLVGLREAADILGVSHQRTAQLAKRPDFPKPIQRLRATPVWLESDVRAFQASR